MVSVAYTVHVCLPWSLLIRSYVGFPEQALIAVGTAFMLDM